MKLHRLLDPLTGLARGLRRRVGKSPGEPSGVLLVSAGGLGDTVLFSLVLPRFIELAQPGETVTVLLRADAARMAFLFPPEVRVLRIDFATLRRPAARAAAFARLYEANFRLVVTTDYLRHPDLDEALIAAARAPETAAMEPRPWPKHERRLKANRRLYRRLFESGPVRTDKVVRWARFADFLTGAAKPPPQVRLPEARMPPPAALPAPTVVIQPFSAVAAKQSPPALYRRIIAALPPGWQVRLAGHPSDLDRNPAFRALLEIPGVTFEGAPFAELAAILRGAALVVSVDTACMHLAAAVGTPTLCLASAAYVGEIVPYDPVVAPANLRVLWSPRDCAGCLGACRFPAVEGMYPCVAALDPERVVAAVRDMTRRAA